ncbi:hypothetical protein FKP32DRAFT_1582018 [Trametes sanguinea]|nr:hypothetical protein FKP32DRAFT_1582018 [Trametes sanguinea]
MPANQHKPLPPDDVARPWLEMYWDMGLNDKAILEHMQDHIDMNQYGLSYRSIRRLRVRYGLQGTRKQMHTLESIHSTVAQIRSRFPNMGARSMVVHLRQNYGMRVPESMLFQYFHTVEPEEVQRRKAKKFKRKRFWTAGVNDVWCFDQHDKWLRFGLFFHLGFEPCAGRILYVKVWWTNKNPRLITSYYLNAARHINGIPLVTQSDPGSENFGIANCHTEIRHQLDATLHDTLQHRWMRDKANIKAEIVWMVIRRNWSPGFESILDEGFNNGWYDPANPLEKLTFLWVMVPWLQEELDQWVHQFNNSPRRADKNKILPRGIPNLITAKPGKYNTMDFKIGVTPDLLSEMEARWAPPDHAVFQLVPPDFHALASTLYERIGKPLVTSGTAWTVYSAMMEALRNLDELPDLTQALATRDAAEEEELTLLDGLRDLRHGEGAPNADGLCYLGGLENPSMGSVAEGLEEGRDLRLYADLSDFEGEDELQIEGNVAPTGTVDDRLYAEFTELA